MAFKVLGATDERTTCDCCGKTNLKMTVALERLDADKNGTGDVVHFGRDCASRAMLGNNKSGNVKAVELLAKAINFANKWLGSSPKHDADQMCNMIATKFRTRCIDIAPMSIRFWDGTVVSK